jgi:predicted RND superfamily exporter protein
LPLVLGFSEGSIIASELGTVVVGGLFTSTFLTLIVVPVVYSLLDGIRNRLSGRGASGEINEERARREREEFEDVPPVEPEPVGV